MRTASRPRGGRVVYDEAFAERAREATRRATEKTQRKRKGGR